MVSAFTGLGIKRLSAEPVTENRLIKIEQLMGNTVVSPCQLFYFSCKKVAFLERNSYS